MEGLRVKDPEWAKSANCATTDPEVMFPEKGGSIKMAKRVCAECLVVDDCLTSSLIERDYSHGVRGGMSSRQRKQYAEQIGVSNEHE